MQVANEIEHRVDATLPAGRGEQAERAFAQFGGLLRIVSLVLPLAWTPNALAWLKANPTTAYTVAIRSISSASSSTK